MLSKIQSFALLGIEALPVEVEVDIADSGWPGVTLIGMADTAIKESRERVKSAINNSQFKWPEEKLTISLAPSDMKKEGSAFDLAIALGILAADEQLNPCNLPDFCVVGELSLEGKLRPVRGILSICMAMQGFGKNSIIVPYQNLREASLVNCINVYGARSLSHAVEILNDPGTAEGREKTGDIPVRAKPSQLDFKDIKGQCAAKRACEVAVAGGHNILMIGPPGSGKTMLARRIPTIMPELTRQEMLEITKIHSASGLLAHKDGLITMRPFRDPHHTISDSALVGGGSFPTPGEISLSHLGVLFLDELPEFPRNCLEALRQPLEEGKVVISRVSRSLVFPSSFMLVCAMNPCPCGYYNDNRRACRCNTSKIAAYIGKISGPLLDRIDLHIGLPALKYQELNSPGEGECSAAVKARVEKTRQVQRERFREESIFNNAQMGARQTRQYCRLNADAADLLKMAVNELGLSARGYDKILKVSLTIADLAGSALIEAQHIAEAVNYRSLDNNLL